MISSSGLAWRLRMPSKRRQGADALNYNLTSGDKTMKTIIIAAAFAALTSGIASADYEGLLRGNPDASVYSHDSEMLGVRPGVGASFDVYHGLADGNPNLFQSREHTGEAGERPNIYRHFRANPDLTY
jgi:hypothetical protein